MKCEKSRTSGYKAITKNDPMTRWEACPRLCSVSDCSQGRILLLNNAFNPDNPLGREMMARQVARQFCRLGEVHSLVYGRRASGENGRKLTASTRVGSKSRLTDYLGFKSYLFWFRCRYTCCP